MTLTQERPARRPVPGARPALPGAGTAVVAAAVAAAALAAGVALAALGARFGVAVMVALPLVVAAAVLVLRAPSLGPLIVVVTVPVGLIDLPLGLDLIQVAAVGVIGLVALRRLVDRRAPLGWDPLLWFGVAVTVVALAGTFRAPDLELALRQDAALVLGLALVCAVLAVCRTPQHLRRVAWTLAVVGAGVCASALTEASTLQARNGGQNVSNRLRGTFTEPNQFGCFSAIVLVLSIGLFLGARSAAQRVVAAGCGSAALVGLGLSLSRGAWIGGLAAIVLLLVLLPQARVYLAALMIPVTLAGLAVSILTPDRPEVQVLRARVATFSDVQGNPYDSRPAIWREAQREIEDSPLLGQGPGQFPVVSTRSVSEASTASADHAHNVLLTVAAEVGTPAAVLLAAFTLGVLARVRRTVRLVRDAADRAVLAATASALAVVVGQGLVDYLFRNAVIFLLHCVLLGLVLALTRSATASPARPPS